jgi:hypothetical protein
MLNIALAPVVKLLLLLQEVHFGNLQDPWYYLRQEVNFSFHFFSVHLNVFKTGYQ